ncbi:PepSY domain-containing protein [Ruminococcus sp.]|uniref:PepSY domain-containing protein n=1 Tax=Ruminococcus sp. TaxID=41978 RepID=UPI002CC76AC3|nr:PepSY domain-containing protein [Ruminococcus sp.]HOA00175.1 PepSY domain-containing protein [Ruminococcus sp.]HOH85975.1 PepSY domain-containing protein [Ruminococcus sp.]
MNRRVLALTAAAVMLSGCSGSKLSHKGSDVPDRPETWSVEQRTLEDITPMTGEEQVYVTRDEETDAVKIIQGVLSDDPINNEREALDLIASYSQVMGYIDVYSELQYSGVTEYSHKLDYRFDQYCDGMQAGYVELMVDFDEGNRAVVLNSHYADLWGFDPKPKVSEAEAVKCAQDKYRTDKNAKAELTIADGPVLAWIVPVNDESVAEVYIDANNGDIIRRIPVTD